jgi:hypothetical protein
LSSTIIKRPCLICGRRASDPHHLRFVQSRALSDEFTVPLLAKLGQAVTDYFAGQRRYAYPRAGGIFRQSGLSSVAMKSAFSAIWPGVCCH